MIGLRSLVVVAAILFGGAAAHGPGLPDDAAGAPAATLADKAARRFPQPVRIGDLIGRKVLAPHESQPVLGDVAAVLRGPDGGLQLLVRFGGTFGIGARPILVPMEAVALMGEYVAILDFTPEQLRGFPAASQPAAGALGADEVIRVGLTKPFH